jgi:hypothetical protein
MVTHCIAISHARRSQGAFFGAAILGVIGGGWAETACAGPLVVNGSFEQSSSAGGGQLGSADTLTGWSFSGDAWLFPANTADTTGVTNNEGGNVKIWGPNDGSTNGLPGSSPDGGNFLALDGDDNGKQGYIEQTISGLTTGTNYLVTFYSAFGQQYGFNGATMQNLTVSLGSQSYVSATYSLPQHGFSGWTQTSYLFKATGASEVLEFLAYGNVSEPPIVLLDGVSMVDAPEPATWVVLAAGLTGLAGMRYRRRG